MIIEHQNIFIVTHVK